MNSQSVNAMVAGIQSNDVSVKFSHTKISGFTAEFTRELGHSFVENTLSKVGLKQLAYKISPPLKNTIHYLYLYQCFRDN